jgi:putative glutathione S-transferase
MTDTSLTPESEADAQASTPAFTTGELTVAADRYRLVWAAMCPTAQRTVIVRNLLGLDKVISLGEVESTKGPEGWQFSLDPDGLDPELGIRYLLQAYQAADPGFAGAATVPALIDATTGAVVYSDEWHLANELEAAWTPFQAATAPNLYPEALRPHIDQLNAVLVEDLFDGVYAISDATTQEEYDAPFQRVFARLDDLEAMLSNSRFLFGDEITDSDILLYVWLVRFDVSYYLNKGVNWRRLNEYPNLWEYARDLYQTPAFGSTTDFEAIKRGYALADATKNPNGIVPGGPDTAGWQVPADRSALSPVHEQR